MKSDITLNYSQVSGPKDAFKKAKSTLDDVEKKGNIPVPVSFSYEEERGEISGKGKGFEISIHFKEQTAEVNLSLSMMLRPFRSKIILSIEKALKEHL